MALSREDIRAIAEEVNKLQKVDEGADVEELVLYGIIEGVVDAVPRGNREGFKEALETEFEQDRDARKALNYIVDFVDEIRMQFE